MIIKVKLPAGGETYINMANVLAFQRFGQTGLVFSLVNGKDVFVEPTDNDPERLINDILGMDENNRA